MKKKTENRINVELAKSVQKALIAHQFDQDKIHETMQFFGLVLGGMIGSLFDADEYDEEVAKIVEYIKQGIDKGLP